MEESNTTFENLPNAVSKLSSEVSELKRLFLEKSDGSNVFSEELLTIQQASEYLNLSVPTLYGYVQRAAIPVCKRGKRLYFSKQELFDWIKLGRKKTFLETSSDADAYFSKKKGGRI